MSLTFLLIEDNEARYVEMEDATFAKLREAIGCRYAEYYYLDGECKTVMVLDEEGLLEGKEMNRMATGLAGTAIVGTVAVVGTDELDAIPYE